MELSYLTKERQQPWTRELHRVLCMQGGDDDRSYARNSTASASAAALSEPFLLEAIASMKLFPNDEYISIADLGCATGRNTLSTVELAVSTLRNRYKEERWCSPEFEALFSDLPSNDFNSLFRSLSAGRLSPFYAAGVPGSFYGRLFPKGKLHLAISMSALHWLSQIPETVLDEGSGAWNKGRAWIDGARKEVVDAYAKQSSVDLRVFLNCRKEEMVEGGVLFVLMAGRPSSLSPDNQVGDPDSRAKHPLTTFMDQAWQDLLNEGLIDEETRDRFNVPAYMRSVEEVKEAFEKCGGFQVSKLEFRRMEEHSKEKHQEWIKDPVSYGKAKANLLRATMNPIVKAHIGDKLSEEFFFRYEKRVSEDIDLLHKICFYPVIVVCATRK